MKVRLNLTIDPVLKERWEKVSKKLGWSKSEMLEDFLVEALPYLEEIDPKNVIPKSLKKISEQLDKLSKITGEDTKK